LIGSGHGEGLQRQKAASKKKQKGEMMSDYLENIFEKPEFKKGSKNVKKMETSDSGKCDD
jgi:hypothetical protein